ncbi:MAG: sulfatase-like hydrolase/transferase, partial [Candidatus Binatia bacterium]
AIPGHDDASHDAMMDGLRALPASRVHVLGWVDSTRLPGLYAAADLALHVERHLYERRLGAENRVIEWLAHGLACVTTAQSETGEQLVASGLALACKEGDSRDLARAIREAMSDPERSGLAHARAQGREWAAAGRSFARTAAPLLAWCQAPRFARDHDGARLVRLGLLSQPQTSVEMLEAYVSQLSTGEVLRRGLRWFARRAWSAAAKHCARRSDVETRTSPPTSGPCLHPPRRLPHLLVLLALGSFVAGGCRSEPPPGSRPNVLLLSIDTLRADHLGAYGYAVAPSPTPWMDHLAARGTLFTHAVSSAPETAPALATLVTGVYQDRHRVMYNRAKLPEENHTLAERFRENGYSTAAFIGNALADAKHGFAQGFDSFEVVTAVATKSPTIDDKLAARFGDFLLGHSGDRPWFAWVHMMEPHGPFNSAPPWWSQGFDYSRAPLARDGEFPVSDSNFGLGVIPLYQRLDSARLLSDYVRRYDGDIRYSDSQVGAVLGMLAAAGTAENTVVVLISDHGESLVEHNELLQHGWFVYNPTVRVPLVIAAPGWRAGRRVDGVTCGVDVAPTILELAGVAADGDDFDGRPIASGQAGNSGTGSVSKRRGLLLDRAARQPRDVAQHRRPQAHPDAGRHAS